MEMILQLPFMAWTIWIQQIFCLNDAIQNPAPDLGASFTLSGLVTDASSGRPVYKAHVYISIGEEESFTNREGKFSISAADNVEGRIIYAIHPNYESYQSVLPAAAAPMSIPLITKKK